MMEGKEGWLIVILIVVGAIAFWLSSVATTADITHHCIKFGAFEALNGQKYECRKAT